MPTLRRIVRFIFGLQAIGAFYNAAFLLRFALWDHDRDLLTVVAFHAVCDAIAAGAWWAIRTNHPWKRAAALAASVLDLVWGITSLTNLAGSARTVETLARGLAGLAGLIGFGAPEAALATRESERAKPPRLPGDGTSHFMDMAALGVALVGYWIVWGIWKSWGQAHGVTPTGFPWWLVECQASILIAVTVHELGHAAAGWAGGMTLRSFQIGPFGGQLRQGRWRLSWRSAGLLGGGAVAMVPAKLEGFRTRRAVMIIGGPAASLLLGVGATALGIAVPGTPWQPLWSLFASISSIALLDFLANLLPQRPEAQYSDGAQLYQVVKNGPWAQVHLAFAMVTGSLVNRVAPRDWDIKLLTDAAKFATVGERGLLLRLFACQHYLERGMTTEACAALRTAEGLYPSAQFQQPADVCAGFTFLNTVCTRDVVAARAWWSKVEAQPKVEEDAEYWLGRACVSWLDGDVMGALADWQQGHVLALALPEAGAYDHTRWSFQMLRHTMNQPFAPQLARPAGEIEAAVAVPA